MYYLIINSSPRKNGNSSQIVSLIEEEMKSKRQKYKILNICELKIDYCDACGYCDYKPKCKIDDDMNGLYEIFDKSKGCIVVSPLYFDSVPGKLKSLIDRTQVIYASKYIREESLIDRSKQRRGMIIGLGGAKEYENQFLGLQIPIKFLFRCINTKLLKEYYITNTDNIEIKDSIEEKIILKDMIENFIS